MVMWGVSVGGCCVLGGRRLPPWVGRHPCLAGYSQSVARHCFRCMRCMLPMLCHVLRMVSKGWCYIRAEMCVTICAARTLRDGSDYRGLLEPGGFVPTRDTTRTNVSQPVLHPTKCRLTNKKCNPAYIRTRVCSVSEVNIMKLLLSCSRGLYSNL